MRVFAVNFVLEHLFAFPAFSFWITGMSEEYRQTSRSPLLRCMHKSVCLNRLPACICTYWMKKSHKFVVIRCIHYILLVSRVGNRHQGWGISLYKETCASLDCNVTCKFSPFVHFCFSWHVHRRAQPYCWGFSIFLKKKLFKKWKLRKLKAWSSHLVQKAESLLWGSIA